MPLPIIPLFHAKGMTFMLIIRTLLAFCIVVLAGCSGCEPDVPPPKPFKPKPVDNRFGRFDGKMAATWLDDDGRKMELSNEFVYIDPRGKRWVAPQGAVVDGASIPEILWSVTGGPFTGKYRNASVVHDVACVEMKDSWEDVHLMFYEACLCGGVEETKAKLMYWAVYNYGPQWRPVASYAIRGTTGGDAVTTIRMVRHNPPPLDEDMARKAQAFFATNNPSLEDIKSLEF